MRKMQTAALMLATVAAAGAAAESRGAVLLSEVLANEVGSDTNGEFIELMTSDGLAASLDGYKIGDEETQNGTSATEALYAFPAGFSIPANDVVVIGITSTRFAELYTFKPDFEIVESDPDVPNLTVYGAWDPDGGIINLSNTNDQAVLVGPGDTILDAVSWDQSTFAFNPSIPASAGGQSYRRINFTDTNTAADWEVSPNNGAEVTRSSPGVLTAVPEPAVVSLVAVAGLGLAARRRRTR